MRDMRFVFDVCFFGFCGISGAIMGRVSEAILCLISLLGISSYYEMIKKLEKRNG